MPSDSSTPAWNTPEGRKATLKRYREKHKDDIHAYAVANREKILRRASEWYKNNRERGLETRRKYRAEHTEEIHAQQLKYRSENHEKILQQHRDFAARNHESILEYQRKHLAENRDRINQKRRDKYQQPERKAKVLDQFRESYQKNKDARQVTSLRWKEANRDKIYEYVRSRRARKLNAEGAHTAADVRSIWERQKHKCAVPGCPHRICDTGKFKYRVDHIVALKNGGSNWPLNLQILCRTHNEQKGAADDAQWAQRTMGTLFVL